MWWTLITGDIREVAYSIFTTPYSLKFAFYFIFQATGVYFNLYFLIPRFLEKGRYVQYIFLVLLTIVTTAVLIVPGYYVSAWAAGKSVFDMYGIDPGNYIYFFKINTLSSSLASMTLGMSVKLTKNWLQTRQRERSLEKEKLETELKFLKSQFNPHFLFNTINSIFVLIHKNPDMASESLAKFSDLLRYQLYECNEHHIPLRQELTYLENFIELEKLRQEQHVELTMEIEQQHSGNFTIAPFILMPFIENAFKHVSRDRQLNNWIKISLRTDRDQLLLEVANSISPGDSTSELVHYSGIGLKNVQRRLDLLYPEKHELTIIRAKEQFRVLLRLHLNVPIATEPSPVLARVNLLASQV
jgi:sensor histidine kinase YesM